MLGGLCSNEFMGGIAPTPLTSPGWGELHPQAQGTFGFKLPSQLVIVYHWLAFLNLVGYLSIHYECLVQNHSYLKKIIIITHELKNPFQNITHLLGRILFLQKRPKKPNDHI